ncbi:MAG TPA: sugar ABC transporter ATP-binding protein [Solirubrobacterales bacterium]|nr:sugar ABC transporter ATP-binding protein [Solirubrobacterales bacterium]
MTSSALEKQSVKRTPSEVLGVRGLHMTFGGTRALNGVDLTLHAGEVHALLGENGAGKSTLIKVLAGVYVPDSGEVRLDDEAVDPHRSKLPIAFIHQDLGLVDSLSIAENIALATGYASSGGLISWRQVRQRAGRLLARNDFHAKPSDLVSSLTAAERSIVAIARALALDARVIVLDEPTASLAEADVARLFDALRDATAAGAAILYVTHRLDEVFRLADRVTVFRNGRLIATHPVAEASSAQLVEEIIGTDPGEVFVSRSDGEAGATKIAIEDAVVAGIGPFSLEVAAGEIVGLTGRRGAGHELVGRCVIGDRRLDRGTLVVDGERLDRQRPRDAARGGIGFAPAKRAEEALATGLSVRENLFPNLGLLGSGKFSWRRPRAERRRAAAAAGQLKVRAASSEAPIETLSGGNQQKVVLTRCLETGARTLVLEEPTTGVDVGTKAEIYHKVVELASGGASVLMISSDFEEVAGVCNRAVVFNRGRIAGELRGERLTVPALISMAIGGEGSSDD